MGGSHSTYHYEAPPIPVCGTGEGYMIVDDCGSGEEDCTPIYGCARCPSGKYTGNKLCNDCDGGTYAPDTGSASCQVCPAGQYSASGSASCSICAPGTYSGSKSASCLACAAGSYSGSGSTSCSVCPAVKYSDPGSAGILQFNIGTRLFIVGTHCLI